MSVIKLTSVGSTNTWAKQHIDELRHLDMVVAENQVAGRGQRGNSWESEAGKNLCISVVCKEMEVPAREQFSVSEAVALSVAEVLSDYGIEAKVKWPNDIYVGDLKICGILIEHSVSGMSLSSSILGIGLNVNQERFYSDAPNPVSMRMLTGREYELEELMENLGRKLDTRLSFTVTSEGRKSLHKAFLENLWRGDGKDYTFIDTGSSERFLARIEDIEPMGFLLLREGSKLRRYAFKEVEFVR